MKRQYIRVVLCAILAAALGTQAQAVPTTNIWLGTSDANWSQPTNWSLSHVPTSTETARFPQEATARTITMPANAEACRIDVVTTSGGYAFSSGGKLTLTKHPDESWIYFNTANYIASYFGSQIKSASDASIVKGGNGTLILYQDATNCSPNWLSFGGTFGIQGGTFTNLATMDCWGGPQTLNDARAPYMSYGTHAVQEFYFYAYEMSIGSAGFYAGCNINLNAYFDATVVHITGLNGRPTYCEGALNVKGAGISSLYFDKACTNEFRASSSVLNVAAGNRVIVNGAFTCWTTGTVAMVTNTVLAGTGRIDPTVNLPAGATLAPGSNLTATAGALTVSNVTMTAGSIFKADLLGATAGTQYDQLVVRPNAKLTLAGATLQLNLGFAPTAGAKYKLIDAGSGATVVGQFACGTSISAAYNSRIYGFTVNYAGGDGNDVVLYVPAGTVVSVK